MNFALAILFSIIYGLLIAFANEFILSNTGMVIVSVIEGIITMNVGLGLFNLIPLPPLDGSKILSAVLPTKARIWYERNEKLYTLFLIVWLTPLASMIISPQ